MTCENRWFSPGTPLSSTNKTDSHDITEILLKVALNTITLIPNQKKWKPRQNDGRSRRGRDLMVVTTTSGIGAYEH